jgi:hypothetical protein
MTNEFPQTPWDLLRVASLPFVYLALGAWYLIAVPLAIAVVCVIAIGLACFKRNTHGHVIELSQ